MKKSVLTTSDFTVDFRYRENSTQAIVVNNDDGYIEGFGEASRYCTDRPDRTVGEKVALTRALTQSKLNRNQRTAIWNEYFA